MSIFYAKIDDNGICQGNTGQILAQWQSTVVSRVALDLPYLAICSAFHQQIVEAIKTASKIGAFFRHCQCWCCLYLYLTAMLWSIKYENELHYC
jgi:hypothetical protein